MINALHKPKNRLKFPQLDNLINSIQNVYGIAKKENKKQKTVHAV